MIEDETDRLRLPLPHKDNFLSGDVERLREAFEKLDVAVGERVVLRSDTGPVPYVKSQNVLGVTGWYVGGSTADSTLSLVDCVSETSLAIGNKRVVPGDDGKTSSGAPSQKWATVYASTAAINTSDERLKTDIEPIPDAVLDAWAEVDYVQYRFVDAAKEKGSRARLHTGIIAQRVIEAFARHGLNAADYGLLCYDEWPAEEARYQIDEEDVLDGQGNSIGRREVSRTLISPAREAGRSYGIRYEEALCLEAALMRRGTVI